MLNLKKGPLQGRIPVKPLSIKWYTVDMLLRRRSTDVNLATYYGTTALTYAIR